MPNARVYYAIRAVGVSPHLNTTLFDSNYIVHGVQSATDTVNFNVNDVLELGLIDDYTSMEDMPNMTVTIEKVLDGYPLVYWQATATSGVINNSAWELGARTRDACKIAFATYSDYQTVASGLPTSVVVFSGYYVDSLDYSLVVDGNFTESVGFVGNDRVWIAPDTSNPWFDYDFTNDTPQNTNEAVLKAWNVSMDSSLFPTDIRGITAGGYNQDLGDMYSAHLQNIRISTSLGRTDLKELGRKSPYYRYANYPVDVTCSIEITTNDGDWKDAAAESINLTNEEINILVADDNGNHRIRFNLGEKNKLTSIDNTGGDTGGGVMTTTYNYTNKNTLTITGDDDPAGSTV